MELAQLPGLALIWMVAVAAPGPDMVLVLQQSITRSRRAGLLAALGITVADGPTGATWELATPTPAGDRPTDDSTGPTTTQED